MNMCEFQIGGTTLSALPSGALWSAEGRVLVVSDMHLGKSNRVARRSGGLLPPYETKATLEKLKTDLDRTRADCVISLGDGFDDNLATASLSEECFDLLQSLMNAREWVWISGNHDPAPVKLGGRCVPELEHEPFLFRHIAQEDHTGHSIEVSGHFHPKFRLSTRAGSITRPAFLWDKHRLMMPAYGAYTGGLSVTDPTIRNFFSDHAGAILIGTTPVAIPAFARAVTSATSPPWPGNPRPRHAGGSSG